MILYLTIDDIDIIRKNCRNQIKKPYEYISLNEEISCLKCFQYQTNIYQKKILHDLIFEKLKRLHRRKSINSIIYILKEIDSNFIYKFKEFLEDKYLYFTEINLIDFNEQLRDVYSLFDKII